MADIYCASVQCHVLYWWKHWKMPTLKKLTVYITNKNSQNIISAIITSEAQMRWPAQRYPRSFLGMPCTLCFERWRGNLPCHREEEDWLGRKKPKQTHASMNIARCLGTGVGGGGYLWPKLKWSGEGSVEVGTQVVKVLGDCAVTQLIRITSESPIFKWDCQALA